MTAVHPDDPDWNSPEDSVYDAPAGRRKRRSSLDIPQIRLLSVAGLESVIWAVAIAHIVKWAFSFWYFAAWQVSYGVGYGPAEFTVWYGKDFWDRLPVHVQNGLPGEIAVVAGLAYAVIVWTTWRWFMRSFAISERTRLLITTAVTVVTTALLVWVISVLLAGWHVHWLPAQAAPEWWVTVRHDIRDVGIALVATIAVQFMFTKPKHTLDDAPSVREYVTSVPRALAAAMVPITLIAIAAWQLPWLTHHGLHFPDSYGALAAEGNDWVVAGTWITVLMGVAGGIVAKPFVSRVADDIQWFFAERSAAKVRSTSALDVLRGSRVIGTPAHRARVRWILANRSEDVARNPWLVRGLLVAAFLLTAFAIAGAWLTIWGPAAVH